MKYDFAACDVGLYLDTHPMSGKALKLHRQYSDKAKELTAMYEAKYGPLCAQASKSEDSWQWALEPWPWDN